MGSWLLPELRYYAKSDLKVDTMGSPVMQNLYMLAGEPTDLSSALMRAWYDWSVHMGPNTKQKNW